MKWEHSDTLSLPTSKDRIRRAHFPPRGGLYLASGKERSWRRAWDSIHGDSWLLPLSPPPLPVRSLGQRVQDISGCLLQASDFSGSHKSFPTSQPCFDGVNWVRVPWQELMLGLQIHTWGIHTWGSVHVCVLVGREVSPLAFQL